MASQAERDMRDLVVRRLRELRPKARIIHEVNCDGSGSPRIDVVAVSPDELVGVEIKSERDSLDRLKRQVTCFGKIYHLVLCLHDAHRQDPLYHSARGDELWRYPAENLASWKLRRFTRIPALGSDLLRMLWRDELAEVSRRFGIVVPARADRKRMIVALTLDLTGRRIRHEVCRCLRLRHFAEADPPIEDDEVEVE